MGSGHTHVSVGGYWLEGCELPLSRTQLVKPSQTRNHMSSFSWYLIFVLHLRGPEMEVDEGMLMR